MAELKTKETHASVAAFVKGIEDENKRKDCQILLAMMKEITGKKPKMWGESIVGFGRYHYKYKSGREGDWMVTGFSPRKQSLTVYIMCGFDDYDGLLKKLGKHKTAVSCLYMKRLSDVDLDVLRELIAKSVEDMAEIYECV